MKNIICFLTINPSNLFYEFCKKLVTNNYEVYICIDDNNYEIPYYDNYIPIIKIDNKECESAGFKSSLLYFLNRSCSRDKALYYFCRINKQYDNIWFIEEDVFIPHIKTIKNIDDKYPLDDLLCVYNTIKYDKIFNKDIDWEHWKIVFSQTKLDPPYSKSMICAIRVSNKLLKLINNYACLNNSLFLDEALFNTIAIQNKLNIITPPELSTIHYKKEWDFYEINISNLYHPMKNIYQQYFFRNLIDNTEI